MRLANAMVLAACVSIMPLAVAAQDRTGLSEADVRQINDASERFAKALLAREWKKLAGLYAPDAVLYPPGEAAVTGRTAIEACLIGLPAMSDFKLRNTKVEGRDDFAYIQGTYMMTTAPDGASKPAQHSGYFVEVRRKQPDGSWLIAVHMLSPHE